MRKDYKGKKWISVFCICMLILSIVGCNDLESNKNSTLQKTAESYEKEDKNELLNKAITLTEMPDKEKEAYENIANISKDRRGKEWLESAIAGTNVLLEMNPENKEKYIYTLVDLYGQKGDFKKADEYIKMLKGEDEEGKIDMIFLYAKYYCYKGKYELAKQYVNQLNISNCSNQKEKYYMLKAFYADKIADKQGVKENIEALLDLDVTYLNTGIVRSIMEESNVAINSSYQECLEKEKEESYKIVLDE